MKKEAINLINCTFEKIAKEQKKKNVTARAIGSGALGAIGGGIAADIATGGGIGNKRSRQIGSAIGAGLAGATSIAKNVRHNRKLEERTAFDVVNQSFEKVAGRMPFTLANGDYATPIGYDPVDAKDDDIEGTWQNDLYRKTGKIPMNYKRIGDNAFGGSIFVNTESDKNNPEYYEYYDGAGLYEIDDGYRDELFTPTKLKNKNFNALKAKGLNNSKGIESLSPDQLAQFGYKAPTIKDKAKSLGRLAKDSLWPVGVSALLGAGMGATEMGPMTPKAVGTRALTGAGVGAAIGAGLHGIKTGFKLDDTAKIRQKKVKDSLVSDMHSDEANQEFLNQYKTASEIVDESFEKIASKNKLTKEEKGKVKELTKEIQAVKRLGGQISKTRAFSKNLVNSAISAGVGEVSRKGLDIALNKLGEGNPVKNKVLSTGIGSLAGIASYSALKHNMDKKGDAEARRRLQEKGIDTSGIKKGSSPKNMAKQIVLNSRAN